MGYWGGSNSGWADVSATNQAPIGPLNQSFIPDHVTSLTIISLLDIHGWPTSAWRGCHNDRLSRRWSSFVCFGASRSRTFIIRLYQTSRANSREAKALFATPKALHHSITQFLNACSPFPSASLAPPLEMKRLRRCLSSCCRRTLSPRSDPQPSLLR